jgi:hypothetical protein
MQIQNISESSFNQIEANRQIIVHEYPHQFGLLDLGEKLGHYGFSWRSQQVDPIVEGSIDRDLIWVGVEQGLAAINKRSGRPVLVMPLTSEVIQILMIGELTAVLTEEEVLLFNPNGALRFNHGLPENTQEIARVGDELEIKLVEGRSLRLNPHTGKISCPEYA